MIKVFKSVFFYFSVFSLASILSVRVYAGGGENEAEKKKPNIVFIFLDDSGYSDFSTYGSSKNKTPNIDRLASEGIKFTNNYSVSTVCSPSRAGLLTGRYPIRNGLNEVFFPTAPDGIDQSEITIAEALKDAGYKTGIVGKWHLGSRREFLPLQHGFDYYYGLPYSNDMTPVFYFNGNDTVKNPLDQRFISRTYTDKAIDFIRKNKTSPFFLYVAHSMPHVPLFTSAEFSGKSQNGIYGDVIEEIDFHIGRLLKTLDEEKLTENTLIIISSDNGAWKVKREHGGDNGIWRGEKTSVFEGGFKVPLIARWPGVIKPNSVYNNVTSNLDWFPTLADIGGAKVPSDRVIDGKDISKVLKGTGDRDGSEILYYAGGILRAYRKGDFKILLPYQGNPEIAGRLAVEKHEILLYNLKDDPSESRNLSESNPDKVKELLADIEKFKSTLGSIPATRQPR